MVPRLQIRVVKSCDAVESPIWLMLLKSFTVLLYTLTDTSHQSQPRTTNDRFKLAYYRIRSPEGMLLVAARAEHHVRYYCPHFARLTNEQIPKRHLRGIGEGKEKQMNGLR
jgi:hypothetical protein